ncbi:hypothetical protein L0U85_03655 [Glycomyces sp. L485]|uniref:hypothetical protein n=1 Tax=Glycomyces sp. L485 TaxID=2909235 RepID=UPI001F4B6E5E|nr:hypothetical protein [Glycomyces sp. L485]MCH7229957.1 hypothetical protein [Glycomyces sp. L485]
MNTQLLYLIIQAELRRALRRARAERDRGDAAEKVITIGAMVLLAIAAMAIIYDKVIAKANGISF